MSESQPTPPEQERQPALYGRTASEWHAFLAGDNLDVPCSRYGRTSDEVAWWAVASMYVYDYYYPGEMDYPEGYADNAMSMAVNDNDSLGPFVNEHIYVVPREVINNLTIEGGDA